MTLEQAQALVAATLRGGRERGLKPLAVVVLDERGALRSASVEDGASLKRFEIAAAKAFGAIALGLGSRALGARAEQQPHFIAAVTHVIGGHLIPVAGGVLIRDTAGRLLGAVGVSGDTSDNDEAVAVAGLTSIGLGAETGA